MLMGNRITAGAVRTTDEEKRALAKQSHQFNLNNRKFKVRVSLRPRHHLIYNHRKSSHLFVSAWNGQTKLTKLVREARDEGRPRHGSTPSLIRESAFYR